MTIKNIDYFISQIWDWGFLDKCFGKTRIKVTDIDGFVERNGNFLVIECKSHDAKIPTGQSIMFSEMVKTGLFVVLIVWGEVNKPERALAMWNDKRKEYEPFTQSRFIEFVENWFIYANKEKR
jgi:hypothetical protein